MKKISAMLAITLIAAALASVTFAYGPEGGWGRGHHDPQGWHNPGDEMSALRHLNLTAEQTEKIKALREAYLNDVKPLRDKMFSKRGELRLLWLQTSPDQNKISAVQKEIRALRAQFEEKQTSHRLAVFNVLTPEQQTKVQAYFAGRGMGGPHHGPNFGPGPAPCRN